MKPLRLFLFLSFLAPGLSLATGTLTGMWRFDDPSNPGLATVGNNLVFQGVAPAYSGTINDDAGNGQTGCITTPTGANANRIIAAHGIAPNGGGIYVNEYTILADILSPAASRTRWRSIFQTNTGNANDGDYFISTTDNLGVGDLGYSPSPIDETKWNRLVISIKLGTSIVAYLNGQPFHTHTASSIDGRFSLDPSILFFADDNGENWPLQVGMLAIWDGALSASEAAMLGTAGAPVPLSLDPFPGSPRNLNVSVNQLTAASTLTWTAAAPDFEATGVRLLRNGNQIAELPLTAATYTDSLPGGASIQEFTYQLKTFGGAVGDTVPPLQISTLWNPAGTSGGLVAYYRFEGDYADSAPDGTDHFGTMSGAPPRIVADGKVGRGLDFNDTLSPHAMLTLGDPAALQFGAAQDFSVAFWLKHPFDSAANHTAFGGNDGNGVIIGNKDWLSGVNRGWVVALKSDGGLTFNAADGTVRKDATIGDREGIKAISDGFWHHVAISCDRDGLATCYLDGKVTATVSLVGMGNIDAGLPTVIGCDGKLGTNPYWLCGSVDEVAIWRRQLTPDDVALVRRRGLTGQALTGTPVIDSDGDGLADGWEMAQFGNLDQNGTGDFDNDGISNRAEYAAGTSATASQSDVALRVDMIPLPGSPESMTARVSYRRNKSASANTRYVVEHSGDAATWLTDGLVPTGAPLSIDANTEEWSVYASAPLAGLRRMFRVRMSAQYQGAVEINLTPRVEYTSQGILISWHTAEPSPTILEYGPNRQFSTRYEDWNLTTFHQVLLPNFGTGDDVALAVVNITGGVETRSATFTTESASNYSPAAVPDQGGFVTGGTYAIQAANILSSTGIRKGHALDAGCGDGKLAYELARQSDGLIVTCLESDPAKIQAARTFLTQRGVYGSRVRIFQIPSLTSDLKFRKGTFNLIYSSANLTGQLNVAQTTALSAAMQAYLVPGRGKSYFDMLANAEPAVTLRPALAYAGRWTTNYGDNGNTGASGETLNNAVKAGDLAAQWVGRPDAGSNVERQVRAHIPLAANGRFYCPCDDEIVTVDSRNGFILWSKQMTGYNRFNMMRDGGNMVCDDNGLYVALAGQCLALNGETGALTKSYNAPAGPRLDFTYLWGCIMREGANLIGTAVKDDAFYTSHWGWDNWFDYESGYGTDQVCADVIFARNAATGALAWSRQNGLVLNVSVTIGDGNIFFLESRNPALPAGVSRRLAMSALKTNLYLVCLNAATGAEVWQTPISFTGGTPSVLLQHANNRLLLTTADGAADRFYLYGLNPANGAQIWTANHAWAKADHGGATQHPVIMNDRVWIEPKCYNLQTGTLLTGQPGVPNMPSRPACATWAGGKHFFLYRGAAGRIQYGGNINVWNPSTGLSSGWTRLRTSCWISAIPADGMILNKEGGGGCSCGAWMETSVGFAPLVP
ncbi:MAG TPA: LamG-like jellyroll fold domain-containing protein [Verrucomicrobiales bacterium]|nr:LamG-like jellyroll fold domain-containing protein [Verrucomicrobiales bacterium]